MDKADQIVKAFFYEKQLTTGAWKALKGREPDQKSSETLRMIFGWQPPRHPRNL